MPRENEKVREPSEVRRRNAAVELGLWGRRCWPRRAISGVREGGAQGSTASRQGRLGNASRKLAAREDERREGWRWRKSTGDRLGSGGLCSLWASESMCWAEAERACENEQFILFTELGISTLKVLNFTASSMFTRKTTYPTYKTSPLAELSPILAHVAGSLLRERARDSEDANGSGRLGSTHVAMRDRQVRSFFCS